MNPKLEAWAVNRYDAYLAVHTSDLENLVNVVAVVPTMEEADSEVDRLNGLRSADGVVYFSQYAPYFPDGRGIRQPNVP